MTETAVMTVGTTQDPPPIHGEPLLKEGKHSKVACDVAL